MTISPYIYQSLSVCSPVRPNYLLTKLASSILKKSYPYFSSSTFPCGLSIAYISHLRPPGLSTIPPRGFLPMRLLDSVVVGNKKQPSLDNH